jgi:hypothetical protein
MSTSDPNGRKSYYIVAEVLGTKGDRILAQVVSAHETIAEAQVAAAQKMGHFAFPRPWFIKPEPNRRFEFPLGIDRDPKGPGGRGGAGGADFSKESFGAEIRRVGEPFRDAVNEPERRQGRDIPRER